MACSTMAQPRELSASTFTKEEAWDRFIMVVKPEQSGKTFVMIEKINEFLAEEIDKDLITVNFVFCDNSLLLTKQTKNRINTDVKKRIDTDVVYLPGVEEHYVELSSRKDGSAKKKLGGSPLRH